VSSVPPTPLPARPTPQPSDDKPSSASAATLTRADVAHLAQLARLELTDQELDLYVGQLSVILDSVATVTAVAAGDIEPTTHAVPLTNVYREDVVRPGLTHEAALAGAPAAEDGRFRVPQILGEEQ
jgi:aspartyl-tRNA(Asn)/glutamyl-tRNA(Gln) amidotransferase subunit C